MADNIQRGPLISAGVFMGMGLGGFVDGILFHQILQVHNMLSNRIPPNDLVSAKINMTWDGYFRAAAWVMTAIGLYLLFRAGERRDVPWSGKILLGSLITGWGLFNLVEGIIDHQILGIHHIMEYASNKLPYDLAFLASGVIFLLIGWALIRAGGYHTVPRGEVRQTARWIFAGRFPKENALLVPPAATDRQFTARRSDVHSPHENRHLTVFQTTGKSGLRKRQ